MKNKYLVKTIIMSLMITILMSISVFAENMGTNCYLSFEDLWSKASGKSGTAYYWNEDNEVIKVVWSNNAEKYSEERDGYSYEEETCDLDGVQKVGGKYFVFEGGSIKEGSNISGYGTKKDAENFGKQESIDLVIEECQEYDGWEDTNKGWQYWYEDDKYIANCYAIVIADENNDLYNLYKFDGSGIGTPQLSNADIETIEKQITSTTNTKLKTKSGTRGENPEDKEPDDKEPDDKEPDEDGNGNGSGNGSGGNGGSGSGEVGKVDTTKSHITTEKQQEDTIHASLPLTEAVEESSKMDLFGMCINKAIYEMRSNGTWLAEKQNVDTFNEWLEKAHYTFRVDLEALKKALDDVGFSFSKQDVIIYDTKALKSVQNRIDKQRKAQEEGNWSALWIIIGIIIVFWGVLQLASIYWDCNFASCQEKMLYKKVSLSKCYIMQDNFGYDYEDGNRDTGGQRFISIKKAIIKAIIVIVLGIVVAIQPMREFMLFLGQSLIDGIQFIASWIFKKE